MNAFPAREIPLPSQDGDTSRLTLRPFGSDEDYARCEALQRATWGQDFAEIASTTMMKISQKVGGVSAGAFDEEGELRGLVFGLTGLRKGRLAHWSHILATDSALRGLGLGRHLKLYQKDFLLHLGVRHMYWTYDPLVAKNAHLNLHRLGAEPVEYHRDFYGDGGDNELHRGIGTDRFIVEWRLAEEFTPPSADQVARWRAAPMVNSSAEGPPLEGEFSLPDAPTVRVEVPFDIQEVKGRDPAEALAWRGASRRALEGYFERAYRVRGFLRDGKRGFYVMEQNDV